MTKQRSNYLYELVGKIKEKKVNKHKQRTGFNLVVAIDNFPQITTLKAFQDKLKNRQIWSELEQNEFLDKRYHFQCLNYFGDYHLIDWKEIVASFSETEASTEKEIKNHGSN